jgi:hypothetical protein
VSYINFATMLRPRGEAFAHSTHVKDLGIPIWGFSIYTDKKVLLCYVMKGCPT